MEDGAPKTDVNGENNHGEYSSKSPRPGVGGTPSKWPVYGLKKGGFLTTYIQWGDPPSTGTVKTPPEKMKELRAGTKKSSEPSLLPVGFKMLIFQGVVPFAVQ